MSIVVDGQGLAEVPYAAWKELDQQHWFTYRGGRNAARFLVYLIGGEAPNGVSELPPPSLQSRLVVWMYAKRDNLRCHLCGDRVAERVTDPLYSRLQPSPDHLTPSVAGGSDYPSNIKTAHLSCNKARRSRPLLTESLTTHSLSDSRSDHLVTHDRKGREGKGREVGHPSIRNLRWAALPTAMDGGFAAGSERW